MLCRCGTPCLVCTKWIPQWQAASVWWDTECSFWGGQACLITGMWGQFRDGKVYSSNAGWPGPAHCCTRWLLARHMEFLPLITTWWWWLLCIILPTHFKYRLLNKNAAILIFLPSGVQLQTLSSVLSCQTSLVPLSSKTVNILSAQHKGFTDWPFSNH